MSRPILTPAMRWRGLALAALAVATIAAHTDLRDLQQGNERFLAGDLASAEAAYRRAEERTDDPGLLAFNRGCLHAARGDNREAELDFLRCLDDPAIPSMRRDRANYNRGVCLLKRGGSAAIYRAAIECFERTINAAPDDVLLVLDARHNLAVAKLRYARERKKSPPKPDERPPDETPPDRTSDSPPEPGPGRQNPVLQPAAIPLAPRPGSAAPDGNPRPTDRAPPGAGTLTPLPDQDRLTPLTPEETRIYLARAAQRLERERLANAELLAGPERKGVRDW